MKNQTGIQKMNIGNQSAKDLLDNLSYQKNQCRNKKIYHEQVQKVH